MTLDKRMRKEFNGMPNKAMPVDVAEFVAWLALLMQEKRLRQADIARCGILRQAVNKLCLMQVKSVGPKMCKAISVATGVPLTTVYKKAGYMPEANAQTTLRDELVEILTGIIDQDLLGDAVELLKLVRKMQHHRTEGRR